jgi:two-component system cell cycle sensor histidine kinase/response regulator CckA
MPESIKLIRVLIVEDNPADAELLVRELRRAKFEPDWHRVDTEAEYLASLRQDLDIILSDYEMPQFNGLRALALLKQQKLEIPFIIVSGTIGEETAVTAMQQGAADYLLKDRITRLGPAVRRAMKEVEDRGERKRLEAQFIEAQKMEVIGHLASGVAHDFNNILGVIIGYNDLMMPELASESLPHNCAGEIRAAAERAVALTRQLLLFSRKQTVQATVLDLNEAIEGMDKMLRRLIDENIELTIICEKEVGRIKADSGLVGQLLMNLVVNARDAMPNDGKLKIETGNVTFDENYARTHAGATAGDCVMLAITDTGSGMTDEVKARLFEAFFTTKPKGKGTGLGLATCQTIVKQCGGCIEVQSELGKGTTFKIYFPRVEQPVEPVDHFKKSATVKPLVRGTETLLLVEDEPSVRHLACSVLEAQGYNVLSANNGQEGLRVARECKGGPIRLVITDVIMPQMSGKVMAEWLKAFFPDLKILFTSGYTDDAIVQHGVLEPGIAFLPKPYTPATLARKVREMLDEKNGGTIIRP